MTPEYRTKAFVFGKKNRGEADRVFSVFSYDFGRLEIYAKSIRKIASKLKGGIDLFCLSEISFAQAKRNTLTDAVLIDKFADIAQVPEKFEIAKKIAKLLENFVHGQQYDHQIYNLLQGIFIKLDNIHRHCEERSDEAIPKVEIASPTTVVGARNDERLRLLYLYFTWNFFKILGHGPELGHCVLCKGRLKEESIYFSPKDGGVVCEICFDIKPVSGRIDSSALKALRLIVKNDWDMILKLKISPEILETINSMTKNYYLYLLSPHSFKK